MNATSPGAGGAGMGGGTSAGTAGGAGAAGGAVPYGQGPAGSVRAKRTERRFAGIAISAGVAIGPVFYAREPDIPVTQAKIAAADIAAEGARLDAAILQSRKQLNKLRGRLAVLPEESQAEIAPLIDAYLRMIGPSRLVRGIRRRIEETLLSAESAVMAEAEAIAGTIMGQAEPGLNAEDRASLHRRAEEVREIARRIVRNLTRTPFRSFAGLPDGAILVAELLRPSDAALLDPSRLAGVAADEGGTDGHTAVMLRALGVPSVLGAAGLTHAARPGDIVVVDGIAGTVMLNPSAETVATARRAVAAFARERQRYARLRRLAAETTDGETVELQANFELPVELPLIAQSGAQGIGLLRTEFLFMNRDTVPDEHAQAETYRGIVEAMNGDTVTIRVLDWGGEKDIEALSNAGLVPDISDVNPAMGLRGLRLLLRRPELFETQLAAILRASVYGPVRVLLPMVTTVTEVRAARETYERVARRLRRRGERRAGETAAARHHDRNAGCRAVRRRAGAGGGFLRHRHQRSDRAYAGGGSRRKRCGGDVRSVASGGAAADPVRHRGGVADAHAGVAVRRDGGRPSRHAIAAGSGFAGVQHECVGGAAGEACGAVGGLGCLRAVRAAGDGAGRPGTNRRVAGGVRRGRVSAGEPASSGRGGAGPRSIGPVGECSGVRPKR